MAGNPREHARKKGFWDGGSGQGNTQESGGRNSGFPGVRKPNTQGIRIDLEQPAVDSKTPSRK